MTPENFCYWLQGFYEISSAGVGTTLVTPNPIQSQVIRDHLQLVFQKTTPNYNTNMILSDSTPLNEVRWINVASC